MKRFFPIPLVITVGLAILVSGCNAQLSRLQALRDRQRLMGQVDDRFERVDCSRFDLAETDRRQLCGLITVPTDANQELQSDSDTVTLPVLVLLSHTSDPETEPLVILQGTENGSAIENLAEELSSNEAIARLRSDRDVVVIDQRGTRHAEPSLTCPEVQTATLDLLRSGEVTDPVTLQLTLQPALEDCATRLRLAGVDFSQYTNPDHAADVVSVLDSLGYEQVNLYGVASGSRLAQFVMRRSPERFRSVVLDGVMPTSVNVEPFLSESHSAALRQVFESCRIDDQCNTTYPDLETTFFELVDQLDRDTPSIPVSLQLDVDETSTPNNGEDLEATTIASAMSIPVNGTLFLYLVHQGLSNPNFARTLPRRIHETVETENYSWLTAQLQDALQESTHYLLNQTARCAQPNYPTPNTTIINSFFEPAFPKLEAIFTEEEPLYCNLFQVPELTEAVYDPVTNTIPTLVMNGQFDPMTPLIFGVLVAEKLPNSYIYNYPNTGQGTALAGSCPLDMMTEFLSDPTRPPSDSCIGEMTVDFAYAPVSVDELELVPTTLQDKAQTLVPEQWQQQSPSDASLMVFADPNDLGEGETGQLIFAIAPLSDLDSLLDPLALSDENLISSDALAGNYRWEIYQQDLTEPFFGVQRVAIAQENDMLYLVGLSVANDNVQSVFEKLWRPALENYQVLPQASE